MMYECKGTKKINSCKKKKLKTATDIAIEKAEEPQVRKMTVKSNRKED